MTTTPPVQGTTANPKTTTNATPKGSVSAFGWLSWPKLCWHNVLCTVYICLIAASASGGAFAYFSHGSGSSGVALLPSGAVTATSPTATSPVRDTLFAPFDSKPLDGALEIRQLGLDLHLQTLTAAPARPYAGDIADRPLPTQRVSAEDAHAMREVIAHYFKDIDESNDVFNQQGELKPSWEMCGEIDFSGDVSATVGRTLKALGVQECFDGPSSACQSSAGRPCQAVCAFMSAFDELITRFPAGPAFAKHAVVGSAISRKYSSWRKGGVVATPANDTYMGSANFQNLGDPYFYNAVSGWAMCDIARTVLQQNANQVARGSCAPTATLSALSGNAAVHALRKATELFWTGRIMTTFEGKPFELKPCEYVYDQVPGMVPLNKHDRPYQAVGLEWYWTATLGQEFHCLTERCRPVPLLDRALPSASSGTGRQRSVKQWNSWPVTGAKTSKKQRTRFQVLGGTVLRIHCQHSPKMKWPN